MARRIVQIRLQWTWTRVAFFLLIEAVLLATFYFQPPDKREAIAFGATVVGAAFVLYSYLRGIEDRRMRAAARLIARWNAPSRSQIRKTLNQITEGQINPEDLERTLKGEAVPKERVEQRLHVVACLNFYEELAISIFEDDIDEDKAYRFFSTVISQTHYALMPWIENERRIDKAPEYYTEFQKLAERWRDRRG